MKGCMTGSVESSGALLLYARRPELTVMYRFRAEGTLKKCGGGGCENFITGNGRYRWKE